jgi:restriction system protein
MTIYEAAIQVLTDASAPLTVREIYESILERDLYDFKAQYPLNVVQGIVRRHTININASWSAPMRYFERVDGGKFIALDQAVRIGPESVAPITGMQNEQEDLHENQRNELQRQIDDYNQRIKSELLDFIRGLSWEDFEQFAGKLLIAYGFVDVVVTPPRGDGGIDGHGRLKVGLVHMNVAFQCKRWTSNAIGPGDVNQFRGAIQGVYEQGVFFTTSNFTQGATDNSIRRGAVPVILIDGNAIVDLMVERELGVQKDEITVYAGAQDLLFEG